MAERADDARFIAVVSELLSAFPEAPPPALDPASPWPEIAEAANLIGGYTWRTAPPEVLDAVHEALSWAEAETFDYWLPGLLIDLAVDPLRAGMRTDALILALTPAATGDLAPYLRTLDRVRAEGGFTEATHAGAVRSVTDFHEHLRAPLFASRWDRLTPAQQTAVCHALEYLATERSRTDATEALARLAKLGTTAG